MARVQNLSHWDGNFSHWVGAWRGTAYFSSALCADNSLSSYICCADNISDPLAVGVEVNITHTESISKIEFRYTSAISFMTSSGMLIHQPAFGWEVEVLHTRSAENGLILRASHATEHRLRCLFAYQDNASNQLELLVRARGILDESNWVQEYWCGHDSWDAAVSCYPGEVWPQSGRQSSKQSWWYSNTIRLMREPLHKNLVVVPGDASKAAVPGDVSKAVVFSHGFLVWIVSSVIVLLFLCLCILYRSRLPSLRRCGKGMGLRFSKAASPHTKELVIQPGTMPIALADGTSPAFVGVPQSSEMLDQSSDMDQSSDVTTTWGVVEAVAHGLNEHWFWDEQDISLEPLGVAKGGFGDVRKGLLLESTPIAVKTCLHGAACYNELTALINEIRLLRRIRHPHVVLFFGACLLSGNCVALVLEWVEGMNLKEYKQKLGPFHLQNDEAVLSANRISWSYVPKLLKDVCFGMQFLHGQKAPIVHRDLKPSNILLELIATPPRAKITDFGVSTLQTGQSIGGRAGTRLFMAPEVVSRASYTTSSDVYSFGRTCCCVFQKLNVDVSSALCIAKAPHVAIEAITSCLVEEPDDRPQFSQLQGPMGAWIKAQATLSL